jgi:hypothetical protein
LHRIATPKLRPANQRLLGLRLVKPYIHATVPRIENRIPSRVCQGMLGKLFMAKNEIPTARLATAIKRDVESRVLPARNTRGRATKDRFWA